MTLLQILVLAVVQGAAELLPVSSSAHVILAERLMGLDPTAPAMTLVLVMLHSGTMLAVIVYFWRAWRDRYFSSREALRPFLTHLVIATGLTGLIGLTLIQFIERVVLGGTPGAEVEQLFGNLPMIATGLLLSGVLIVFSGTRRVDTGRGSNIGLADAARIGIVQAFCIPFRGFSRSGATISTGLLLGVEKRRAEEFSFALAVILTPAAIAREALRLLKAHSFTQTGSDSVLQLLGPSLAGLLLSFVAGLLALRLLSRWLESGRWQIFGYYCFFAAATVLGADRLLR